MVWIFFKNMVRSTRQVHYEVGQGSDTQGTATMQDTQPPPVAPPPLAPVVAPLVAPLMIGAEQLQQLLGGVSRGDDYSRATKNFSLYGGTRFDGLGGVLKALAWIEACDEAFARMPLTPLQRRDLATQNLDGPALNWWRAIWGGLDLDAFTWDGFLLRFHVRVGGGPSEAGAPPRDRPVHPAGRRCQKPHQPRRPPVDERPQDRRLPGR